MARSSFVPNLATPAASHCRCWSDIVQFLCTLPLRQAYTRRSRDIAVHIILIPTSAVFCPTRKSRENSTWWSRVDGRARGRCLGSIRPPLASTLIQGSAYPAPSGSLMCQTWQHRDLKGNAATGEMQRSSCRRSLRVARPGNRAPNPQFGVNKRRLKSRTLLPRKSSNWHLRWGRSDR